MSTRYLTKKSAMRAVQEALSDDLMSPEWLEKRKPGDHFTFGHCYLAAETLFHIWGRQRGYVLVVLSGPGWTHWFLARDDGSIADPTAGQWKDERIPYEKGRRTGFLTKHPSKRYKMLMTSTQ